MPSTSFAKYGVTEFDKPAMKERVRARDTASLGTDCIIVRDFIMTVVMDLCSSLNSFLNIVSIEYRDVI